MSVCRVIFHFSPSSFIKSTRSPYLLIHPTSLAPSALCSIGGNRQENGAACAMPLLPACHGSRACSPPPWISAELPESMDPNSLPLSVPSCRILPGDGAPRKAKLCVGCGSELRWRYCVCTACPAEKGLSLDTNVLCIQENGEKGRTPRRQRNRTPTARAHPRWPTAKDGKRRGVTGCEAALGLLEHVHASLVIHRADQYATSANHQKVSDGDCCQQFSWQVL
jgi:hypothetical protein